MFHLLLLCSLSVAYPASQELNAIDNDFKDLDIYFKTNRSENYTKMIIPFSTSFKNATSKNSTINPLNLGGNVNETRNPRQETFSSKESQEADSSEEEEGNMLTGLLGAFLGGFSKPDGGIDLDAILGLLGSLITQNDDGSYDFSGLTELLRSFLGGGDDGGGSDIGAFTGGLLGAIIKGVANPPGPKGAGILTGKVVTGLLPALSGPAPLMNGDPNPSENEPPLDSGSFLTGFIRTALGSNGNGQGGRGSKYTLFKLIFSAITGIFSAASSLSSKGDWN